MFVDIVKINVKAGDGGNGAVSFRREKYVPAGGPDGGNGGKGGSIIFAADDNMSTLLDFRYKRNYAAESGQDGQRKKCYGKDGEDLIIKVPRGTVIKEAQSELVMADISADGLFVLAKGGSGGKGNAEFATPTRQAPRFAKPGFKGESYELILELKLLADVGIVGFPNVGKSTLISVVSAAKPKIANYHFTTLIPTLGVVNAQSGNFVMADIPGIIKGASKGVGLGISFLRHIERCRLIIHMVDVSGQEGRDPIQDYETIEAEMREFNPAIAVCPQIVAANKCDTASDEQIKAFERYIKKRNLPFYKISAATTQGTKQLIDHASLMLRDIPPAKEFAAEYVHEEKSSERLFNITLEDGIYAVDAPWLEPIIESVNIDDYESLQYFQRVIRSSGIIDKLEEMGIKEDDTVNIMGFEFNYRQ
ncbi:MAG: GTPase ObgE [Oscillospiraceae bacterium]|nr:GTPase ObgE [Oscillospiraceae bacterium]